MRFPKLSEVLLSFCNTKKDDTLLNRLHIDHSYLTHSFILEKRESGGGGGEAPVCVTRKTLITVKHVLIECAG